jgi:hypothetical protein
LHFPPLNPAGFETFELDRLKVEAILFQTGYLTIQSRDEDGLLILDYPNKEVRDSMLENLIEGFRRGEYRAVCLAGNQSPEGFLRR